MVEVDPKTFEAAKEALVHLINGSTDSPIFFTVHDEPLDFPPTIHSPIDTDHRDKRNRVAYFFLQKLDFLINPLLLEIAYVERDDIDANFVLVSKYFDYLTWVLRNRLNDGYNDTDVPQNYRRIYQQSRTPLEDYFQKNRSEKVDIKDFAEQIYLAVSRMRSDYFPDEIIIKSTEETNVLFDAVEAFIKEYKRALEGAAFDTSVAIGQIKAKFEHPAIDFDPDTSALLFQGKSIEISKTKNSDPHYLLAVLFKDKGKSWAYDEVWDDPYFQRPHQEYDPKKDWRKIYYAARSVNEKVAKATTIADLLSASKTSLAINKAYL